MKKVLVLVLLWVPLVMAGESWEADMEEMRVQEMRIRAEQARIRRELIYESEERRRMERERFFDEGRRLTEGYRR